MTIRRTLPALVLLIALLATSQASAQRPGGAGHNPPTRKLEAAFKIALYWRSVSEDGCYPSPSRTARLIAEESPLRTGVAHSPGSVGRMGVVFVIRGSNCNKIRMALRHPSGLYVLDSAKGTIRVLGRRGAKSDPGKPGPARGVRLIERTFKMTKLEEQARFEVFCPGGTFPLGGGTITHQLPDPDGEGIYVHSYERLGAQRGFHVSPILFDPSRESTDTREITVQVVCGRGLESATPTPHKTVFIKSGEIRSATARCPKGQQLVTGGFQRTNFGADGGNYVTESRAVGPRAWRVSGSAFPLGGGELTAIAYCVRQKRPILTEVSSSTAVPAGQAASATTPRCPDGLRLTTTGFSTNGDREAFYVGSSLNDDGSSTATAFGHFGAVPSLTAYGYCIRVKGK
ncbi:MAG TPA: hypothetical protein VF052_10535 [Solirubrobacterales bacterium]